MTSDKKEDPTCEVTRELEGALVRFALLSDGVHVCRVRHADHVVSYNDLLALAEKQMTFNLV